MSLETNKAVAVRFRETLWERGGLTSIDQIVDPNCVIHVEDDVTPGSNCGPDGLKRIIATFLDSFPDADMVVQDMVAEADKVCVYWTATATHKAPICCTLATDNKVTTSGIDFLRLIDGKIVEARTRWDALGLMCQIGAVQLPAS